MSIISSTTTNSNKILSITCTKVVKIYDNQGTKTALKASSQNNNRQKEYEMYKGYIFRERPRNTAADEICTLRSAISTSWPPSTRPQLSTCIDIRKIYNNLEEQVTGYILESVSVRVCVQTRDYKRRGE